jgi:hypothetical protein
LLGVVLAIFVPTFLRRVRMNKISEAPELLSELSHQARAYYDTSWSSLNHHCLPPAAGPTPPTPSVDAREVDFSAEDVAGHATWDALGFQPERPIRFSYRYLPSVDGCGLTGSDEAVSVVFRAEGDLDADGVRSTFQRRATITPDGFTPAEVLLVHRRTE